MKKFCKKFFRVKISCKETRMKSVFKHIVIAICAIALPVFAAPKCPQCKMELAAKADKKHSVAVKIGGKTLYCCADCGAHTPSKVVPKKGASKSAKKPAVAPKCPKCKMQMSFTKSLLKGTAMKVNGTTYYCCTICPKH
jgi:hypothetical protein